jgi:hypothetical protein
MSMTYSHIEHCMFHSHLVISIKQKRYMHFEILYILHKNDLYKKCIFFLSSITLNGIMCIQQSNGCA